MKVAIVHDWLIGGGAERVIEQLHILYPEAPIYTSYASDEWRRKLDGKVVTGWPQRLGKVRKFIPILRILWFTRLDFSGYDLVISSSGNGEARGVKVPKGTLHIAYCNTPTHFYWRHYKQYLREPGFGKLNFLARIGLRILVSPLRKWDYRAAQRADYVIANSSHIKKEIKQFYGRESSVIYPPVDTLRFRQATSGKRSGFITAGRQVPLKKTSLIVEACNRLGLQLTVAGRGPEHELLKRMAGPTVTVLDEVSDKEMSKLFGTAQGFIFASYEDFGITPVEALAAGTPVIAYRAGGALDYVVEGKTGMFFDEQTLTSLTNTLKKFRPEIFNESEIQESTEKFSEKAFRENFETFVANAIKERQS